MYRGRGRLGFVVGIQPGSTEVETSEAFSGQSGARLVRWLCEAAIGNTREEIFEKMYFTSLAKCGSSPRDISKLVQNCRPYLARQIQTISPKVLITLGERPLRHLFGKVNFEKWVCQIFSEEDIVGASTLFPLLPRESRILSLPHPSPLSRWLNDEINQSRLKEALLSLRIFLGR
jgi:uracil-DNA glycosylase family 4